MEEPRMHLDRNGAIPLQSNRSHWFYIFITAAVPVKLVKNTKGM
jgi:hypothetical protein